jgi:hypothetical protein
MPALRLRIIGVEVTRHVLRLSLCFLSAFFAVGLATAIATPTSETSPYERIGACTLTVVTDVGYRAGHTGSAIQYANGSSQIDYNEIAGIHRSRAGDRVLLCLTEVPTGCPPGDLRGRIHKATNLRTRESWAAMNSEHSCGGA